MVKQSTKSVAKKPTKTTKSKQAKDFHPMRMTVAVSAAAVASLFLLCLLIVF